MAYLPTRRGIASQGTVSTTGAIIYQPTVKYMAAIHNLTFNNTSGTAFNLTLRIYRASTSTSIQLYYMELLAGDFIQDGNQYELHEGDYLYAIASVTNTVFTVSGTELLDLEQTSIPT